MIILLFATVLDGRNPGAVGSGSQISHLGPHRRARLTLVSAAHTLPCKLRRAAMRQSRILLVRDIIQHPKGAFDFMKRVSKFLLLLLICALAVLPGQAQTNRNVRVNFKETTLKNG